MRAYILSLSLAALTLLSICQTSAHAQNRVVTYEANTVQWQSLTIARKPDGGITAVGCGTIDLSDGTSIRGCSSVIDRNQLAGTVNPLATGLVRRGFSVGDGGL